MSSPNPNEPNESSTAVFIYKDVRTGELYQYSRKGLYKKSGRTLIFIRESKGEIMKDEHILNKAARIYADEKAGYPPNCNEGYVEKDGKCVPKEKTEK
tara:strand:- start:5 stop:298 length:294 start_codon:yes stop_codon:yes gene_type:complete